MNVVHAFSALLLLAGGRGDPPDDSIDRFVREFIARHRIPSAAIAVVHNGRVVKSAGYGQASLELPAVATDSTVYEIGSITKQFTAEVVMLLASEGKIDLAAPIATYLDGLPDAWARITVRHLLTHTSGLPDWEGAGTLSFRREYTGAEFIQLIASRPLDFAPGDKWAYTNSAFPLLGMIMEKVTGESYEQLVTKRILAPAGMTRTRFRRAREVVPNRAAGYVDSSGVFLAGEPLRPRILLPNGGILSTAGDMAKWDMALARGAIIPGAIFDRMATPITLNDGKTVAFAGTGWFVNAVNGHRALIHNGATAAGYSSVIYHYPEDHLFVVVLLNIDRGDKVNELATAIAGLVVPAVKSAPPT
jgi:CubicO group peptidase (beta-lactamase class C family)